MSNNFGLFLLFSVLITGLIANSAFAEETIDVTETIAMTESSNSTSTEGTTTTESNSTSTEGTTTTESNSTSTEDEMVITGDAVMAADGEMTETEGVLEAEIIPTIPSPLKQIKEGIVAENVVCKEGLGLVFKLNGQPACVKTTSIEKLIAWGWAK